MAEYIIKQSVLDYLNGYLHSIGEYNLLTDIGQRRALTNAIQDISAIKAADVQPVKHGRWIEQRHTPTNGYNYNVPYSTYICSSCGLEIHNDEYSKYVRGTYTNCPVCTARMDGDTNG